MAKKGQKFRKLEISLKLEISKKHFNEGIPEGPLAKEYGLPIGTIRYIFNNYKMGYGFERPRGPSTNVKSVDYKLRYEILKKYQTFLKEQKERR